MEAAITVRDVELNLGALVQRTVAAGVDAREVCEDVIRAVIGGDEAEALVSVEPFNGASSHVRPVFLSERERVLNFRGSGVAMLAMNVS